MSSRLSRNKNQFVRAQGVLSGRAAGFPSCFIFFNAVCVIMLVYFVCLRFMFSVLCTSTRYFVRTRYLVVIFILLYLCVPFSFVFPLLFECIGVTAVWMLCLSWPSTTTWHCTTASSLLCVCFSAVYVNIGSIICKHVRYLVHVFCVV